jgi:SAM-dependent methyltransferase
VLDAGCGIGTYAVTLAQRGHRVTAVDVSDAMLSATERAARDAGVADRIELIQADLRRWTPHRTFTTVLNLGVAEYYRDSEAMLACQYAWAERRLLVTWSAAGVGPRAPLRRMWLGLHGLRVKLLEEVELAQMLGKLPGAQVRTVRTHWTHCAVVSRVMGAPSGNHHAPPPSP